MYGKAFASMYTGSMMGAGAHVFAIWNYAIANCGREGTVELNPVYLATVIGMSADEATAAIEFLAAPDPRSRTKEHEGRRLVFEGGFAWTLVNHKYYRALQSREQRREYLREKQQQRRDKLKREKAVSAGPGDVSAEAGAEADNQPLSGADDPLGLMGPRR